MSEALEVCGVSFVSRATPPTNDHIINSIILEAEILGESRATAKGQKGRLATVKAQSSPDVPTESHESADLLSVTGLTVSVQ